MNTITETNTAEQIETVEVRKPAPKLTCVITGTNRPTNQKYLESKAAKRGVTVDHFVNFYTSKQAVKRLRAGMSVEDVRQELNVDPESVGPVDQDQVNSILHLNGKIKQS
jgi:hypothetical protein|tara:strand:- start:917 stop:1246 length:330 start_codon:yes stop_codon:yes gene_type:complete